MFIVKISVGVLKIWSYFYLFYIGSRCYLKHFLRWSTHICVSYVRNNYSLLAAPSYSVHGRSRTGFDGFGNPIQATQQGHLTACKSICFALSLKFHIPMTILVVVCGWPGTCMEHPCCSISLCVCGCGDIGVTSSVHCSPPSDVILTPVQHPISLATEDCFLQSGR